MIIALLGNDGSGKTTIAKALMKELRTWDVDVRYRHEYDYVFLKFLFRLFGQRRIESSRQQFMDRTDRKITWYLRIWPYLVWIDNFLSVIIFNVLYRKKILILDRYAYDMYLSFEYLCRGSVILQKLFFSVPRPTLGYVLEVDPEIAFERKKSTHTYNLSFYRNQRERYVQMAKKVGLPIVNTNIPLDEVTGKLLGDILRRYGWRRLVRSWSQNRVLYSQTHRLLLCSSLQLNQAERSVLERIQSQGKQKRAVYQKTLGVVEEIGTHLSHQPLILKTVRSFSWVPCNDVDVIVHPDDWNHFIDRSIDDFKGRIRITEPEKADVLIQQCLKIDLHQTVSWRGIRYVDPEFITKNPRYVDEHGVHVRIPSVEADLLSVAAKSIFEVNHLTLNDAWYLRDLLSHQLDMDALTFQVRKYHWERAFDTWLSRVRDIVRRMSSEHEDAKVHQFPFFLPWTLTLSAYIEKFTHDYACGSWSWTQIKVYLRDLVFFMLWRIRYVLSGILQFHVSWERIDESIDMYQLTSLHRVL